MGTDVSAEASDLVISIPYEHLGLCISQFFKMFDRGVGFNIWLSSDQAFFTLDTYGCFEQAIGFL